MKKKKKKKERKERGDHFGQRLGVVAFYAFDFQAKLHFMVNNLS